MKARLSLGASLAVALLLAGSLIAAEGSKSGPQPGDKCAAFSPKHVTGPDAGKSVCFR